MPHHVLPPSADAPQIVLAVLAAGGSHRLGRAKQLLVKEGQSLLRSAAKTALAAACGPVVVVLGARAACLQAETADLQVTIVVNDGWASGLASSVRAAVHAADRIAPGASGILITLADQPRVTPDLLRELVRRHRKKPAHPVACGYAGTVGVPALFPRSFFPELLRLQGDRGARDLLRDRGSRVEVVPFPGAALDIDTNEDIARGL